MGSCKHLKIETNMATKSKHSIEEKIEDWCKKQFNGAVHYASAILIVCKLENITAC